MDKRTLLKAVAAGVLIAPLGIADGDASEADLVPANRLIHWAPLFYHRLRERKVSILPVDRENFADGCRITAKSSCRGAPWQQMNAHTYSMITSDLVIMLADQVAARSNKIRCGLLWLPSAGVISTKQHEYRNIILRELSAYDMREDAILTRLDVLFCDGHAESA
jgi:prepilin-type processing-associated H-X9-DG protein